jgi:hypothetical protein
MNIYLRISCLFLLLCAIPSCGSNVTDQIRDAIDIADGVPEKDIDRSKLAVNAFFNDQRFGSIPEQFAEIQTALGINHVRVLLAWDDNVQPTPSSPPNFSFYDDILGSIPPGVDALVIMTGVPSWMSNPANWIEGNPRRTFAEQWVKPVTERYGDLRRISAWQIWNEPNQPERPDNVALDLGNSPTNFVELVSLSYDVCKASAPNTLVVNGSTTAINQNFPGSLDYNRALRDAGLFKVIDVFGMHYYGRQFENVVRSNGVADFLSSVPLRIWVTESGAQGVGEQKKYVRQVWPYLSEKVPTIDRFYYYQMYESSDPKTTYALRNLSTSQALSDLYLYIRDNE